MFFFVWNFLLPFLSFFSYIPPLGLLLFPRFNSKFSQDQWNKIQNKVTHKKTELILINWIMLHKLHPNFFMSIILKSNKPTCHKNLSETITMFKIKIYPTYRNPKMLFIHQYSIACQEPDLKLRIHTLFKLLWPVL